MKHLAYVVKIISWWPDFDETLCSESLCSKYISILSKVVIKMNRAPQYWHLKIKQEVKFLKTCGLRRVTQGYTGLHFVQVGATVIFYFLAFFKFSWDLVTDSDQL